MQPLQLGISIGNDTNTPCFHCKKVMKSSFIVRFAVSGEELNIYPVDLLCASAFLINQQQRVRSVQETVFFTQYVLFNPHPDPLTQCEHCHKTTRVPMMTVREENGVTHHLHTGCFVAWQQVFANLPKFANSIPERETFILYQETPTYHLTLPCGQDTAVDVQQSWCTIV